MTKKYLLLREERREKRDKIKQTPCILEKRSLDLLPLDS